MIVPELPPDADDCEEIAARVLASFTKMFADMRRSDTVKIAAGELTLAQHAVLKAVMNAERPIRVSDLAAQENLAVPSMTIAIRRLQEQGLVERLRDPNDNRSVLIVATAKGAAAYNASVISAQTQLAEKLGTFADAEFRALAAALPALRRLVDVAAGVDAHEKRLVGQ